MVMLEAHVTFAAFAAVFSESAWWVRRPLCKAAETKVGHQQIHAFEVDEPPAAEHNPERRTSHA